MHQVKVPATNDEAYSLTAAAAAAGKSRAQFLRDALFPLSAARGAPIHRQLRYWVLELEMRTLRRTLQQLHRERDRVNAQLGTLTTSPQLCTLLQDHLREVEQETLSCQRQITDIQREAALMTTPDTPNLPTSANPVLAAIAFPSNLAPDTVLGALAIIATIAGLALLYRSHRARAALRRLGGAGHDETPYGDSPRGANEKELLSGWLWDPRFLADRIQDFVAQPDGEERLRELAESASFEVAHRAEETGRDYPTPPTTSHISILVVNDEQRGRIPVDVLLDLSSRRARPLLDAYRRGERRPTEISVPVANGHGEASLPPKRGPGRPRKDAADKALVTGGGDE